MSPSASLVVSSVLGIGINFAVLVAFIVVVLTVVRQHRPDAVPLLLGALGFEALLTAASFASSVLLTRLVMPGGMDGVAAAQSLNTLLFSLAHAGARCLLIWGIVRLARPLEHV